MLSVCNFDVFITVKVNLPEARVSKKKKNIHEIVLLFSFHVKSELILTKCFFRSYNKLTKVSLMS